jgi:hypothetical protein
VPATQAKPAPMPQVQPQNQVKPVPMPSTPPQTEIQPVPIPQIKEDTLSLPSINFPKETFGKWSYDTGSLATMSEYQKLSAEEQARVIDIASKISLEIKEDSTLRTRYDQKVTTGSYSILRKDDKGYHLETKMGSNQKETIILNLQKDQLILVTSSGPAHFKKETK